MKISTIVPTYRRPQDLKRCLQALQNQSRLAEETIVIVRDTDTETWNLIANFDFHPLFIKTYQVTVTGVVAAMNLGLEQSAGDVVAFTDDDAAPHPDWLEKIEAHFLADEKIGGVGGRDILYCNGQLVQGEKKAVGKLQWFGRVIGNHHLGTGNPREVDVLKGVNMSFRHAAIKELCFDRRMKGTGAQVHFELAFCLALKKRGWKLIYDPDILVDHYSAQRFDEDRRNEFNEIAWFNEVHNGTLAIQKYLTLTRRTVFVIWSLLIGTRKSFGLVQWLRFFPKEGQLASTKLILSMRGLWQGLQTWKED